MAINSYKTDHLEQRVKLLQDKGARITSEPMQGEAFNNNLIAFLYIGGGLNIELIDTGDRAELLE